MSKFKEKLTNPTIGLLPPLSPAIIHFRYMVNPHKEEAPASPEISTPKHRVFIVEDHPEMAKSIVQALSADENISSQIFPPEKYSSLQETKIALNQLPPNETGIDIFIIDIGLEEPFLPGAVSGGLKLVQDITKGEKYPNIDPKSRIIIHSITESQAVTDTLHFVNLPRHRTQGVVIVTKGDYAKLISEINNAVFSWSLEQTQYIKPEETTPPPEDTATLAASPEETFDWLTSEPVYLPYQTEPPKPAIIPESPPEPITTNMAPEEELCLSYRYFLAQRSEEIRHTPITPENRSERIGLLDNTSGVIAMALNEFGQDPDIITACLQTTIQILTQLPDVYVDEPETLSLQVEKLIVQITSHLNEAQHIYLTHHDFIATSLALYDFISLSRSLTPPIKEYISDLIAQMNSVSSPEIALHTQILSWLIGNQSEVATQTLASHLDQKIHAIIQLSHVDDRANQGIHVCTLLESLIYCSQNNSDKLTWLELLGKTILFTAPHKTLRPNSPKLRTPRMLLTSVKAAMLALEKQPYATVKYPLQDLLRIGLALYPLSIAFQRLPVSSEDRNLHQKLTAQLTALAFDPNLFRHPAFISSNLFSNENLDRILASCL